MNAQQLKSLIKPYQEATLNFEVSAVKTALAGLLSNDVVLNLCYPFHELMGSSSYFENCLLPLSDAIPDLERRDMIVLAGTTPEGKDWIGTMGNYIGTSIKPFLQIPATGHLIHMRYHEFFMVENGKVVEIQAIWDIPELMVQANAWPLAPQLGKFMCTPSPMSGDGLTISGDGSATYKHVIAMLTDLCRYPNEPDPRVMQLEKYWHPRCNWYGPTGIGTSRGISGFRNWHQIPFLRAMPDRKLDESGKLMSHWFAQGEYVCETGWPNMRLTLSDDGWMGIAPAGKEVLLRSLDFWRTENGLIRENWVLVDLLDLYQQIGVDVFARLAEFNKAKVLGQVCVPSGISFNN